MQLFQDNKKPLLERLVDLDIESQYTKKARIWCHLSMWLIKSVLDFIYYTSWQHFNVIESLISVCRNLLCNATFFYLFFYFAVPIFLSKGKIFSFFLSSITCCYIWIVMDFLLLKAADYYWGKLLPLFHDNISNVINLKFVEQFSLHNFFTLLPVIISFISPFAFIKIIFDITNVYSKLMLKERKVNQLEIDNLNIQNEYLLAQLNPHFLFNTFNNLYALSVKKSPNLSEMIERLSDMMRYTVYECHVHKISLQSEIEFIKNYIYLEQLRVSNSTEIVLDIKESVNKTITIAPLLIFPFVENAFKYGLKSDKEKFIRLHFDYDKNIFQFRVENDKTEFEKHISDSKYSGVGIKNVRDRLDLLYKNRYELILNNAKEMFSVILNIEL